MKSLNIPIFAILLLYSASGSSYASARVATTVAEAVVPAAARVAVIEATEKTAATMVDRNFQTIVAEAAASSAATARVASRPAGVETIEATGKVLRPDHSNEVLAVGVGGGLGTGIYSVMSKTGEGIGTSLEQVGAGLGNGLENALKNIVFLLAGLGVVAIVLLFALSRVLPTKRATIKPQSDS